MGALKGRRLLALALSTVATLGEVKLALPQALPPCEPAWTVADSSSADYSFMIFEGRAGGETFFAEDTIISAITFWKAGAPDTNVTPMHLYVMGVTPETGFPDPARVLLDGPTLVLPYGDGIHPIRVEFDLDPPLVLPGRGTYYFTVKEGSCSGFFWMLTDTLNSYPLGKFFRLYPSYDCSGPGISALNPSPDMDLLFEIEYCRAAVPTRSETWGRVKAKYR